MGGGCKNTVSGKYNFMGGGRCNTINCNDSTLSGGYLNVARANGVAIGGGCGNVACGITATIAGGFCNLSSGQYSSIGGGGENIASGQYSFIGGGRLNQVSGCQSGILGGCGNTVANTNSFVIGSGLTSSANNTTYVEGFSKTSGTFRINHPDPTKTDTKYLQHSFVESPTRGDNIYRYKITTVNCAAVLALPDYYKFLNEDDQIFVTPQGHFGTAYGVIDSCQEYVNFVSNVDGDYNVLIIGTRKDADAIDNFTGVEIDK
jgi:hypothetical protein